MMEKLLNLISWKSNKKILVFLADDYGAELNNYKHFAGLSLRTEIDGENRFSKFDGIALRDDLTALFDVLKKHQNTNGKSAVFTAVSSMANVDLEKFKSTSEYAITPIKDYLNSVESGLFKIWEEGMQANVFVPELHGREHLNASRFLRLIESNAELADFFNIYRSFPVLKPVEGIRDYLKAYDFDAQSELVEQEKIIVHSISIFENSFGRKPSLFVAPGLISHKSLNQVLVANGVLAIDKARKSREPKGQGKYGTSFNYTGKTLVNGKLKVLSRNIMFEPNATKSTDWAAKAAKQVDQCFASNVPAIVSTHRVNYVGAIDENNRKEGLSALDSFLSHVVKNHPDVEFMSASELIQEMHK